MVDALVDTVEAIVKLVSLDHKILMACACYIYTSALSVTCADERFCERQNPCTNGGQCLDTGPNLHECICPHGFNGSTCESSEPHAFTPQ